jgi:hypothetical protein
MKQYDQEAVGLHGNGSSMKEKGHKEREEGRRKTNKTKKYENKQTKEGGSM